MLKEAFFVLPTVANRDVQPALGDDLRGCAAGCLSVVDSPMPRAIACAYIRERVEAVARPADRVADRRKTPRRVSNHAGLDRLRLRQQHP